MKLIMAIVRDRDASTVIDELTRRGYGVTRINTYGGFLKRGNATILTGVEDADGGFPDVSARSIAFNKRDDRVIWDAILAVAVFDLLPVGWDRDSVERRHYTCLQKRGRNQSL